MLVPFRPRPHGTEGDHVGENEPGDRRLPDIGVDMSGQRSEPRIDGVDRFGHGREVAALAPRPNVATIGCFASRAANGEAADSMRYPMHHGRAASFFLTALAVAMLIMAGGLFAHADALKTDASDCHGAPVLGELGDHEHAGSTTPPDCDAASNRGQLHCGASILVLSSANAATFVSIRCAQQPQPRAFPAGSTEAVEPPPPRFLFQTA